MIIRECRASDAAGIASLFREFVAYLRSVGDDTDYRFGAEQYLNDGFGVDPIFRGLVAEAENTGELVGYVLFSRTYDGEYLRTFYIVDLYVQQDHRSSGIGRMLMDAVSNLAIAESIARLSWSVHKNNVRAIQFYEAIGAKYSIDTCVMHLEL